MTPQTPALSREDVKAHDLIAKYRSATILFAQAVRPQEMLARKEEMNAVEDELFRFLASRALGGGEEWEVSADDFAQALSPETMRHRLSVDETYGSLNADQRRDVRTILRGFNVPPGCTKPTEDEWGEAIDRLFGVVLNREPMIQAAPGRVR
ncbi:MAG TPA: hypothetical protein VFA50_15085 [Stellaceae bacterium]|nr:hypothetical protein [Stellaceae bacterium]